MVIDWYQIQIQLVYYTDKYRIKQNNKYEKCLGVSMYNCHDDDALPANTPHRPDPGKATDQRLQCRSVSSPAPAQRLVFARVEQYSKCMQM